MSSLDFYDKCNDMMRALAVKQITSFGSGSGSIISRNINSNTEFADDYDEFVGASDDFVDDFIEEVAEDDCIADLSIQQESLETEFVSISLPKRVSLIISPKTLEEDFLYFLFEQNYVVSREDTVLHNWNSNFSIKAESDEAALQYYMLMHYGVYMSQEAVIKYKNQLTGDVLKKFGMSKRELSAVDVELLIKNVDSNWFDSNIFNDYAVETRDTGLILDLLKHDKVDTNMLTKYTEISTEALNAYLQLILNDVFTEAGLDAQIAGKTNLQKYVEKAKDGENNKFSVIENREDVSEILKLLDQCEEAGNKVPEEILNEYAGALCLPYILKAYLNGVYDKAFIDDVLCVSGILSAKFVPEMYVSGEIDFNLYQKYKDPFIAIFVKDVLKIGITSSKNLVSLIKEHKNSILLLLKAMYQDTNSLTSFDYHKFLILMCSEYACRVARYIEGGIPLRSFNSFCIKIVLQELNKDLPTVSHIGKVLILVCDSVISSHTVEEIIFNKEIFSFLDGKNNINAELLPDNNGIIVGNFDLFDTDKVCKSRFGRTSLESVLLTKKVQKMIDANMVNRCNAVLINEFIENSKNKLTAYVQGILFGPDELTYGAYDMTIGFILEYYPELSYLLCAENSKYYLQVIKMLSGVTEHTKFIYQFLFYVLRAQYGKKFTCRHTNLSGISSLIEGVVVYGLANVTYLPFKDLLHSIDGLLDLAASSKSAVLSIEKGKITIKFRQ
ncbi:hypothetical protein AALB53_13885 [Lachnospiraceae bacterium 47-T17]